MLQKISPKQKEGIRLLALGYSETEVAKVLDVTVNTVSNQWMKDPLFQSELRDLQHQVRERTLKSIEDDVSKILMASARKAADICKESVFDGTVGGQTIGAKMRLQSAWDVLDRAGFGKTSKHALLDDPMDLIVTSYQKRKREEEHSESSPGSS